MSEFAELRETYKSFLYEDYSVERTASGYRVTYHFSIPGLADFRPVWEFPALREADETVLERLFFHLGMAETISYWKCACPPEIRVLCGGLSREQKTWWRRLYYNGLGEFLYRNGIEVSEDDLVHITCGPGESPVRDGGRYGGCMVPIGGGKDSVVSLELLRGEDVTTYSINPGAAIEKIVELCDYKRDDYRARRVLDKTLLELNARGFLNGHTPFSAIVAFSSVIAAHLSGRKYIALSNETSANETTVRDSFVNHQYSKSFDFERDFAEYFGTVTDSDIHYFSLLRPLTEIQIAMLFSRYKQYHRVFRSCNAGSKQGVWCCACPKCLFVYIILLPFLSEEELLGIFGEKLLDKESLERDFRELTGIDENKPFECVGTRREVRIALKHFVDRGGQSLLTQRYREQIEAERETLEDILGSWTGENRVPEPYSERVKRQIGR